MAASCLRKVINIGVHRYSITNRSKLPILINAGSNVFQRSSDIGSQSILCTVIPSAKISTSKKNKVVTVAEKVTQNPITKAQENLLEKEENWMSFGYSLTDRDEDEWAHHMLMFCGITLLLCWGGFFISYYPDLKNYEWAQREAYLELERRKANGLPLVDPNMIDPSKIELPSEEELGDFEIVI